MTDVKKQLADAVSDDSQAIADIKSRIEDLPFEERQPLWDEIDKREKNILDTYERLELG